MFWGFTKWEWFLVLAFHLGRIHPLMLAAAPKQGCVGESCSTRMSLPFLVLPHDTVVTYCNQSPYSRFQGPLAAIEAAATGLLHTSPGREHEDGLSQAPEVRRPGCWDHIVRQLIRPVMNDEYGFLHH
jgi:hypothetical protein